MRARRSSYSTFGTYHFFHAALRGSERKKSDRGPVIDNKKGLAREAQLQLRIYWRIYDASLRRVIRRAKYPGASKRISPCATLTTSRHGHYMIIGIFSQIASAKGRRGCTERKEIY